MDRIMDQKNHPPASLAWLVWGLGAAFYFTAFYHRVAPAVMTDQLMAEFRIGATEFGQFSAFYFYSYVFMQIPTGILADHWGPRKLLAAGSLVAALGTFLFASASSIAAADLGRLLIGGRPVLPSSPCCVFRRAGFRFNSMPRSVELSYSSAWPALFSPGFPCIFSSRVSAGVL